MTTAFEPVRLPLAYKRVHVVGAEPPSAEVPCVDCGRVQMPLAPCEKHADLEALKEFFPPRGPVESNVPGDCRSDGVAVFACLFCRTGVAFTWAAK